MDGKFVFTVSKDWLSNNFREIKLKAVQKAPQTWKLLSFQP